MFWGQASLDDGVADEFAVRVKLVVIPPQVAVTMNHPLSVALVVNPKDPLLEPAVIMSDGGTCTPTFEDFKVGAISVVEGLLRRTVQIPDTFGRTDAGVHVKDVSTGVAGGRTNEMLTLPLLDP
jgi:hypothetical protein